MKWEYKIILLIVNKLTKYSYIISFKEKYIVKQLKTVMFNRFIKYYEIIKEITSNRATVHQIFT